MRIANSTIVRNYTRGLNSGLVKLNKASNSVYTQRRFTSMSEDTSSGIRALQLRRSLADNYSYTDTAKTMQSQYDAAETQMMNVAELGKSIAERYTSALNGTNGPDEYKAFYKEVEQFRNQILTCANGQFSDRYLFGGTNTTERPFSVDDNGDLLYNGKNVADMADANGNVKPEYQYLMDDAAYVDLGMGMTIDANGNAVENSVFKSTFNGLEFMGIGGDNIYQVCTEIMDALSENDFSSFQNNTYTAGLLDKITSAYNGVTLRVAEMGADSQYLDFTVSRLQEEAINLIERQDTVEFIDPAEAIMQFKMQEYSYNASLQMGQRILQPTLFSFIS